MAKLQVSRTVDFPDGLRVARAKSLPGLGPRLLFFSGGSALNNISRRLKDYTHNSVHLITPFDSGGSSQVLRQAFDMPAVGDLRSRLMALADETELGQPDIFALFTYRFPKESSAKVLAREFDQILRGTHPLMEAITQPMRGIILQLLRSFASQKPEDFDLRGASIGNLILAGGYFTHDRALEPVLFLMSKMVAVHGTVRAVVDENLDLGAVLADGSQVLGQKELTGKEAKPIQSRIEELFLHKDGQRLARCETVLPKRNRKLLERADLICFSPGSLYTSIIANFLPQGVGRSIADRSVPKVYIPSLGTDPECVGMDLYDQVGAVLSALRADVGQDYPAQKLMNVVITDKTNFDTCAAKRIQKVHGISCIGLDLRKSDDKNRYDPTRMCEALISLV